MAGIFDRFPELLLHPCADKQSVEDKLGLSTRGRVEAPTIVRSHPFTSLSFLCDAAVSIGSAIAT